LQAEYERRLAQRRTAAAQHQAQFRLLGNLRLLAVIAGIVLGWWNYWLLPIPVAAFLLLIAAHERVERRASLERRGIAFYERGLARINHQWTGTGESGERFRDASHPYADDLDLFGRGSLFQLINAARTAAGETTLARWLMKPAAADDVRARQEAVEELRHRLDLREDLALLGEDVRAELHADSVIAWGAQPPEQISTAERLIAFGLAAAMVVAFSGYMLQFWSYRAPLVILLGEIALATVVRARVLRILGRVELPGHDLRLLAELLARFEQESLTSPLLVSLKRRLETGGRLPSDQIRRLRRLIELNDQSRNQMFALLAKPLMWSTQCAFAIERWRQTSGGHIGEWLEAVGEMEALCSLAGYAAEHPSDPFPELLAEGPRFEGEGIAHPLLLPSAAVRNNVSLGGSDPHLLLISGSNMSGKSTLLRSVGLNTVLAWAGAPVRAHGVRVSPLAVGASMRVQDSIQDGKSRFYAEITRLRLVVDMASAEPPLLFLLDELLSGTNSHDRLIGADAVVTTLVERGAIGLVTTHDLALAHVAERLAPRAINVHFEDHIEDGRIAFDYRMRSGVVQKSNALELMRSVGLEV
jgi:hypothetical protein